MHPVERQRSELRIPSTGITLLEGQDTLEKTGDYSLNIGRAFFFQRGMLCIGLMAVIDSIQAVFPSMRSLDCPIEDGLRRLYIGRGFTLHQLHALIQRIRHEVALTQASMIVVDGMLAMFLDEQIKRFEAVPFYAIAWLRSKNGPNLSNCSPRWKDDVALASTTQAYDAALCSPSIERNMGRSGENNTSTHKLHWRLPSDHETTEPSDRSTTIEPFYIHCSSRTTGGSSSCSSDQPNGARTDHIARTASRR